MLVNRISRQELVELFEYRLALESAVVASLAVKMSSEDRVQLEQLFRELKEIQVPSEFTSLDRRFHEKMAELCGNRYLIKSLNEIWDMVEWLGVSSLRSAMHGQLAPGGGKAMELTRLDHGVMLSALSQGDPSLAKEAIAKHLRRVEDRYLQMWQDMARESA